MKGKLRHLAIQCDDPAATAEFYKRVFALEELSRIGLDDGAEGAVYLSDGTINLALIRISNPHFPNFRPKGLNHIGFVVEDLEKAVAKATENGAYTILGGDKIVPGQLWEHKMVGPDSVGIDLYDVNGRGWPGIGALEDLGVQGTISAADHQEGRGLKDATDK